MSRRSKSKSLISTHNLLIILCLILIGVSVHILFKTDEEDARTKTIGEVSQNQSQNQNQLASSDNDVKVVQNGNSSKAITEQEARSLAKKQFKELNEKWINEKDLEVLEFSRANEYYYYISSKENTIEIKKDGGIITRINSVPVE